jgi:Type I phosphodiesterase / nucleotide pyrophosphatase
MKRLSVCFALVLVAFADPLFCQQPAPAKPKVANPVVIQFMVDGIDHNTVRTAIANGATSLASLLKQGVTADTYYCTSPAPRLELPDGSRPWGGSTSSNVAMHTGTHLFESYNIDDIFLSAKRAGITSAFAGGSQNYAIFKNATYLYYGGDELTDAIVVDRGLQHLTKDNARLLRLHLQHIRNAWHGPSDTTNPKSEYIQYFVKTVDPQLARLIAGLKQAGVWERTYIIFGSDHGMGQTSQSGHPQSVLSSWRTFMAFYGPGIKRGATIPYAEGPDVAVMTNHFLGLPPLRGHLDEKVPADLRGVTGVFLENIFEGGPADVKHHRLIERYLKSDMPRGDNYVDYRAAMIKLLQQK